MDKRETNVNVRLSQHELDQAHRNFEFVKSLMAPGINYTFSDFLRSLVMRPMKAQGKQGNASHYDAKHRRHAA